MITTDRSYSALGISKERYWEIVYYVRQYRTLSKEERDEIDSAFEAAGVIAAPMKKHIIHGAHYKGLDVPYSEAQFKRIKKRVILALDRAMRGRTEMWIKARRRKR